MPDSDGANDSGGTHDSDGSLDAAAEHLYGLVPDGFVPARDDAVARARERGERDLARAISRLRRPTRAAWLANLLARQRGEQLDGLILLAADLAAAQRTLDGEALRALSSQRHRLVTAMAREAGRLARAAGEPVGEALLRELQGILEAALADPAVAAEVRAGRLTRAVTYSGFGPDADPGAVPAPARRPAPTEAPPPAPDSRADERERRERERRERDLADAERDEAAARDRQWIADAERDDAETDHGAARDRVAALTAELDAARERERGAVARARASATAAKDAARAAGAAATRTARARAHLEG